MIIMTQVRQRRIRWCAGATTLIAFLVVLGPSVEPARAQRGAKVFLAGAHAIDVSPTEFPTIVNGSFLEKQADRVVDPLFARCLVLDDGTTRVVIAVVDSCMMPRDLLDEAKRLASAKTGIAVDRMLISATHTHTATSAMGALGTRADPAYVNYLPGRIAEGIVRANASLRPARVGWTSVDDFEHTHCRRWILRSDKMRDDPFGTKNVRAHMHPGYRNPDFVGPAGPVDPELSLLSIQARDGAPIALLANYSMHYFGDHPVSADYYGRFAARMRTLVGGDASFVGIMSQGTSGDQHWMDYSEPKKDVRIDDYAAAVAQVAHRAYEMITYRDSVSLAMAEATLELRRRVPDAQRLAWANKIIAAMKGERPKSLPEVYAHEQRFLHDDPVRELKLQALRIGDLGITAIPDEVYALTGLKIKAQSPLPATFNIELANGSEGYIPPPEQHKLGGYTTWPARTAGLEETAEPKIVETVLGLLEKVAGRPRREVVDVIGPYARAVTASMPRAYWRFSELAGTHAHGGPVQGTYEDGIALYLEGPTHAGTDRDHINRAVHFAGGRMTAAIDSLGGTYSVEMWFYNGMPVDVRPVTGYLFSRGRDGDADAGGDHLGIAGTAGAAGRLLFYNGNVLRETLTGREEISIKTWNHVVLVREGEKMSVYLNGRTEPEITGRARPGYAPDTSQLFIGGRNDNIAGFEGKIDEVAVYDRVLSADEIAAHYHAAGRR